MADDELMPFDPSMKKKKKKKKTPFDLDGTSEKPEAVDGAPTEGTTAEDTPSKSTEAEAAPKQKDEEPEQTQEKADDDFSLDFGGLKKKKKKKKAFEFDEMKEALPETTGAPEEEAAQDGGTTAEVTAVGDDAGLGLDLTLSKKKKKRKKNVEFEEGGEEEKTGADAAGSAEIEERLGGGAGTEGKAWLGSDRDYSFDELLTRVFDIMKEKNPDMVAGEKKKIVMRPPQVLRVGAKKSSFANFADICRMLHRQPKHVLAFLLAELGTSGSVDGNNQLIIKGRFNQKQIENVLRRYIKEYVTCHTCKSPDTSLQKEERLFFLQCETCGSRCSVQSIKSGFQAVTGRRAALRASNA